LIAEKTEGATTCLSNDAKNTVTLKIVLLAVAVSLAMVGGGTIGSMLGEASNEVKIEKVELNRGNCNGSSCYGGLVGNLKEVNGFLDTNILPVDLKSGERIKSAPGTCKVLAIGPCRQCGLHVDTSVKGCLRCG